jgi:outer membrane protein assembly factor BamD (BamD/ComL family)
MVLRDNQLVRAKPEANGKAAADLQAAHELYRQGEYAKAEKLFHKVADNTQNTPSIGEEARYFEAECLRRQDNLPKACDTYNRLLNDFHFGAYRDQSMERMFAIADFWLQDTREEIRRKREAREKDDWFVMPTAFVHVEKSKPLLDEEGRALEALENIVINDLNGKRADEALYLSGSVRFYREDYREADRLFSELVDRFPNSKYAPQAVEYAIMSKHMSTGGSDYDGRKVAEARKYVDLALHNHVQPPDKAAFLDRQLAGITAQQAEKDFKIAEFYRRTGHPGSAYFYYEVVRRRYPGSPYCAKATERMNELKASSKDAAPPSSPQPAAVMGSPVGIESK